VLSVTEPEQSFEFAVAANPVPSLLRGFSAPVILNYPYADADLLYLMAHDDDPFARWEAGQRLAADIILRRKGRPPAEFLEAARRVLAGEDHAFIAEMLTLPSETFLAESLEVVDPDALHAARLALRRAIAEALQARSPTRPTRPRSAGAR